MRGIKGSTYIHCHCSKERRGTHPSAKGVTHLFKIYLLSSPHVPGIVLPTDFCSGVTNPLLPMRKPRHGDVLKLAQGLTAGQWRGRDSNLVSGSPRDHVWDHSTHRLLPGEMTFPLIGPWRSLPILPTLAMKCPDFSPPAYQLCGSRETPSLFGVK